MRRIEITLLAGSVFALFLSGVAGADPLPGRSLLKFSQRPLLETPLPPILSGPGHRELSTAHSERGEGEELLPYEGTFAADDFADRFNSPVVHVKWWGSYLQGNRIGEDISQIEQFLISFEADVPADPENPEPFSHPGQPLLSQIVTFDPEGNLTPGFREVHGKPRP